MKTSVGAEDFKMTANQMLLLVTIIFLITFVFTYTLSDVCLFLDPWEESADKDVSVQRLDRWD